MFGSCQEDSLQDGSAFTSCPLWPSPQLLTVASGESSIQEDSWRRMINSEGALSSRGPLPGWWRQCVLPGLWNSNDVFQSVSHWRLWKFSWKKEAVEAAATRATAGEQKGEISAIPKIDDSVEPKKTQIANQKGAWRMLVRVSLKRIATWLFLSCCCRF